MKTFQNYIVFKTPVMFDSHVEHKGVDGRRLEFDPSFNPWLHVRRYGEVVEVPERLGTVPLPIQIPQGTPQYHEYAPAQFKYLADIEPDVEVGDRIYFHYHTVNMRNLVKEEGEWPNRVYYFRVRYDQVICAVREITKLDVDEQLTETDPEKTIYKVIIPIGSYTLVQPDWESWDDILIPTYSHLKNKKGEKILKPKDQWIQTKKAPEYRFLRGTVRHIGPPLRGDTCECAVGDMIYYRRNADWMMEIEGENYFAIMQRHILGRMIEEKPLALPV